MTSVVRKYEKIKMKNRDEKKRIIQLKISKKINNKKMGNT
jgi:hypothetical protein